MKKIISVLMVAVCLMMAAPAQAQLHFGVKGGLNISKLSFSKDAFKGDNKTGFFVGPMAEFTLPIIGIGADVAALYSQTDLGADGEKTMKLKTFAVPVNLKWSFGLGSMLGAYIAAGPQFDFNIGNKTWTRELSLKKSFLKNLDIILEDGFILWTLLMTILKIKRRNLLILLQVILVVMIKFLILKLWIIVIPHLI